ncbi:MAG TPA: class I SAM-dependent methyltransferase [Trueperaceae bacterium]|jgi:SAM-dependent methyltransferase
METSDAVDLIRGAVSGTGGTWADLGAGTGTFTRALAELVGAEGTVYAVDRDPYALAWLTGPARPGPGGARLVPLVADIRSPLPLEGLDGVVVANALHFVPRGDQERVLGLVASYLRPGGALVLVEYDQRLGSPWVPHPVPPRRFADLARAAGLGAPREVGRRRSRYGPRDIYAAVALT